VTRKKRFLTLTTGLPEFAKTMPEDPTKPSKIFTFFLIEQHTLDVNAGKQLPEAVTDV
jgi:hypothetical protein